MDRKEIKILAGFIAVFLMFYLAPLESSWLEESVLGGVYLLIDYAKLHILTCLVPAFFIAGAIATLIQKDKVLEYLGPKSKRSISYAVASVSGTVLAVCSCTILPLFAGIRKRGAGLGPATTFLFAGPAINIAAIFLTMSVLGFEIGLARIISAIILSVIIGMTMSIIFREDLHNGTFINHSPDTGSVSGKLILIFFALMIGILVINGISIAHNLKYLLIGILSLGVISIAAFRFSKELRNGWLEETWALSKQILPLLFIGVFVAGFVMPLIPDSAIQGFVGENTISGNIAAALFGGFMYFSTLTEIPILEALIAKGMSSGPALALLLAGPSLSLPNMLVIRGIIGSKKTAIYIALVIFYSALAGFTYGIIA
jgi:hypothetical protein